ncbi:MAG: hypothetical protein FD147_1318 [Chloroflexi bacterium]|nr:MAG: hypothetical protein FD147_1318 [Chloroflexota bacterium]
MQKTLLLFLLMFIFVVTACTPILIDNPTTLPITETATDIVVPADVEAFEDWKPYQNSLFGLGFQYPSGWLGPDEYISDQDLRVEVGSDVVYPYGTGLESRVYELKNSYYVTIQYSKNSQNDYWKDTYQSLLKLKDGESLSGARSLVIKIRQLNRGSFEGIEYISTLSETAQTEHVYSRQVILFDSQSNIVTIMGTPNNVDLNNATDWRAA